MPQPAILVVDDDESIGTMLKMMLEHKGFKVTINLDARNLDTLIAAYPVDLILLDLLINGIKGTDVCAALKSSDATKHIPIIMMTALPGVEKQCFEAGANDFIAKPFEMDLLLDKVNAHIR